VDPFWWILLGGIAMSAIALVGSVTILLPEPILDRIVTPLVALAAGSLLGGAFFHMLPAALGVAAPVTVFAWAMVGFCAFFALEVLLHRHHCHRDAVDCRQPFSYLILIGDALHNFLGGLGIGGVFLLDTRAGLIAWVAAAAHEIPQELGDFGVLLHAGWSRRKALLFNLLSGLTFLVGGMVAYVASTGLDVDFLIPFAAGNFIYIGASDLIPEVRRHGHPTASALHLSAFVAGLFLLWAMAFALQP